MKVQDVLFAHYLVSLESPNKVFRMHLHTCDLFLSISMCLFLSPEQQNQIFTPYLTVCKLFH